MPRAATTSDAFNAIAEPRRRDILDYLAIRERSVGDIVAALGMTQPSASKHLRVLRDVGLVEVRRDGRQVFYRTNIKATRPLYEWTGRFERHWRNQLNRVKQRAERNWKWRHYDRGRLSPRQPHAQRHTRDHRSLFDGRDLCGAPRADGTVE